MNERLCKKQVFVQGGWRTRQCSRRIWKDGYCKQHHPDSVKKREQEKEARWLEKKKESPYYLLEKANCKIRELEEENKQLKMLLDKEKDILCQCTESLK